MSVRRAYEQYLKRVRRDRAKATVQTKRLNLIHFVRWCEQEEIETPAELTGYDFELYQDHRSHVAPSTLENEMNDVRLLIEFCEDIEIVEQDFHEKVNVPRASLSEQSRDEKLELEDAASLLAHFRDRSNGLYGTKWHALLEIAWHTGARIGGIRSLDLCHYDRDEHVLEFRHQPKTDTPLKNGLNGERDVGILPEVADAIDTYIAERRFERNDPHGRAPLFTTRTKTGRPAVGTLRAWMYQATQPCWYEDEPCPHQKSRESCSWTVQNEASKCPSSVFPHAVRTGSITFHQDRGFRPEQTADRVDDDVETIEKHYDKATKRNEMERRRRPDIEKLRFNPEEYLGDSDA